MNQVAPKKILVLCTGNSCRSVMAEALINAMGQGRLVAYSAGSQPTGQVHPRSLATLKRHGLPADGYRSQSWDDYTTTKLDLVITVCDSAAAEVCPVFPGAPAKMHWSIPDPAYVTGTDVDIDAAFDEVFQLLKQSIQRDLLDQ